MKVIVQWMPDEAETVLYELNPKDYIVDKDTYNHFLNEVFFKEIEDYLEKKHKVKLKDTENVEGATRAQNMFDNQDLIVRYWPRYNKIRPQFYLYKDDIYSYEFISFMNVGHVIEICKYDMLDLCNICNEIQKKKRRFFK